ncbi:hypothetical protein AMTR_s00025p00043160 [Amborella trichopoda]|uniref:Uncharacterized protein n=1 Tax=Amborella trichopoda TaxID=13333 RepID=W1PW28_AMBTC|nr:hypothetical protein AMTR_s00025p00043160 [Amborella trichopoda]
MDPSSAGSPASAWQGILRVPLNPYSGDPLIVCVPTGSPTPILYFNRVSSLCVCFPSPTAPPPNPSGYTPLEEIHPPLTMIPAPTPISSLPPIESGLPLHPSSEPSLFSSLNPFSIPNFFHPSSSSTLSPVVEELKDPLGFYDDSEDQNPNPNKDKLFESTMAIFRPTLEDGLAPIGIEKASSYSLPSPSIMGTGRSSLKL